jgi:hypothetical protein
MGTMTRPYNHSHNIVLVLKPLFPIDVLKICASFTNILLVK